MDCGPSLRKVGLGVVELLIRNCFSTFDPGDLEGGGSHEKRTALIKLWLHLGFEI